MPNPALRQAIAAKKFVAAPGVFDMISALIADRMGFEALYVTGYGTVASALGLPDAGLATYSEMIEHVGRVAERARTPVIADADTGYGGLLNVRHTTRGYEKSGVSAMQIEDQEFPKKCGHTPNRRVVATADMVRKIEVACDSRSSADFLIVARTDARTSLGLDEALRRAEAYAKAGADVLFIESPESEAELAHIAARLDKPLLANMVNGGRTPMLTAARLAEIGYALAIFPVAGFLAASRAMQSVYDEIHRDAAAWSTPLTSFAEFNELIGFPEVWAFEKRYPEGD